MMIVMSINLKLVIIIRFIYMLMLKMEVVRLLILIQQNIKNIKGNSFLLKLKTQFSLVNISDTPF